MTNDKILFLTLFLLMPYSSSAQPLASRLHDQHDTFREKALTYRRFRPTDLLPIFDKMGGCHLFTVQKVGESVEQRPIFQVKAGSGPVPVLLWSQMHGDEATATMALFDLFNFLNAFDDGFDDLRRKLLANLTIYAVPMLNPDGAERFQRRNAYDIDINRDALRLSSPEGRLLKHLQQTLKPVVGFNLHDQSPRYSVGNTGRQAAISFLATAYDADRSINEVRKRSMQLIVGMNRALQPFIPGRVGRYDDAFEPRAFGDNIQKWGTTLILIESGGYPNDPEKQYLRKLNFVAIVTALAALADKSYTRETVADYQAIPENGPPLFDLLIRNATVQRNGKPVVLDIGINRQEIAQPDAARPGMAQPLLAGSSAMRRFAYQSRIEDVGDLSTFHGLTEIDATSLTLAPPHVYADTLDSPADLQQLDLVSLRQAGTVAFRVRTGKTGPQPTLPVQLLTNRRPVPDMPLIGQNPTFLLLKRDEISKLIINGFVVDQSKPGDFSGNGIIE